MPRKSGRSRNSTRGKKLRLIGLKRREPNRLKNKKRFVKKFKENQTCSERSKRRNCCCSSRRSSVNCPKIANARRKKSKKSAKEKTKKKNGGNSKKKGLRRKRNLKSNWLLRKRPEKLNNFKQRQNVRQQRTENVGRRRKGMHRLPPRMPRKN